MTLLIPHDYEADSKNIDSDNDHKIRQEVLFLIAKLFFSIEPLKDLGKQLVEILESSDQNASTVDNFQSLELPKKITWNGDMIPMNWNELFHRYRYLPNDHIISLCKDWISCNNTLIQQDNIHGKFHPFLHSCIELNDSLQRFTTHSFFGTQSPHKLLSTVHNYIHLQELGIESMDISHNTDIISRLNSSYQEAISVQGHSSPIYCAIFDKKEKVFITGGDDGRIKSWCVYTGRLIHSFRGHADCITDLAITPDNRLLASASNDSTIRMWDISNGKCVCVLKDMASVCTVEYHPLYDQGIPLMISSTSSGLLRIWKIKESKQGIFYASSMLLSCKSVSKDQIHCLGFTPGATKIIVGGTDGIIRIFKTPSIKDSSFIDIPDDCISYMTETVSPNSPRSLSMTLRRGNASVDQDTTDIDISPRAQESTIPRKKLRDEIEKNTIAHLVAYFDDHNGAISVFDCSPNGSGFVSGAWDGTARIRTFDTNSNTWTSTKLSFQDVTVIPPHRATVTLWTKDDRYIVTASTDHIIRVWNIHDGQLKRTMNHHTGDVYVLTSHPVYPNIVLSAGCDGRAIIYDIHNGDLLFSYEYAGRPFLDGQFSPSGVFLILSDVVGACTLFALSGCFSPNFYKKTPKEQFFPVDFREVFLDNRLFAIDEATHIPAFMDTRSPTLDSSHIPNPYTWSLDYGLGFDFPLDSTERNHELSIIYHAQRSEQYIFSLEDHFFSSSRDLPKRKAHQIKDNQYFYGEGELAFIPTEQHQPETEERRLRREQEEASLRAMMEEDIADEPYTEQEETESEHEIIEEEDMYIPKRTKRSRFKKKRTKIKEKRQIIESFNPPSWTRDINRQRSLYIPQIHDQVAYFVQGHEAFVEILRYKRRHFDISLGIFFQDLPWKLYYPFPYILKCTVESIRYNVGPPVWCELKLGTNLLDSLSSDVGSSSSRDKKKKTDTFITVRYFIDMENVSDFIILWDLYEWGISRNWNIRQTVHVVKKGYPDRDFPIAKIVERVSLDERYPESDWKSIKIEWISNEITLRSGRRLRRRAAIADESDVDEEEYAQEKEAFCSPWEFYERSSVESEDLYVDHEEIPLHLRRALMRQFNIDIMELEIAKPFVDSVDLDDYPDYCLIVPYPMDLGLIMSRIEGNYYRRIDAINADVELIRLNALAYNEPGSEYPKMAKKLVIDIQKMISIVMSSTRLLRNRRYVISDESDDSMNSSISNMEISRRRSERITLRTRNI